MATPATVHTLLVNDPGKSGSAGDAVGLDLPDSGHDARDCQRVDRAHGMDRLLSDRDAYSCVAGTEGIATDTRFLDQDGIEASKLPQNRGICNPDARRHTLAPALQDFAISPKKIHWQCSHPCFERELPLQPVKTLGSPP